MAVTELMFAYQGEFMKNVAVNINLWSFTIMLLCWVAFFSELSQLAIPINPHYIILSASIIVFIFSVVGLGGTTGWRSATLSITSILGSIALFLTESWVVFIGRLLS